MLHEKQLVECTGDERPRGRDKGEAKQGRVGGEMVAFR